VGETCVTFIMREVALGCRIGMRETFREEIEVTKAGMWMAFWVEGRIVGDILSESEVCVSRRRRLVRDYIVIVSMVWFGDGGLR